MYPEDKFTMAGVLRVLRETGWTPGAIIDIGVSTGTKGLYSAWDGVPICLIEPSREALPFMQEIAARHPNVHIFNFAASNRTGKLVGRQAEGLVNVAFGGRAKHLPVRTFKARTCDDMVAEAGVRGPFLYKLDTDAHEREILEGSARTLAQAEVCIVEANVFHVRRRCMTPTELWGTMAGHGFTFFDVADASVGQSGVTRALDFVFVRESSELFQRAFERSGKSAQKAERRAAQQQGLAQNPGL